MLKCHNMHSSTFATIAFPPDPMMVWWHQALSWAAGWVGRGGQQGKRGAEPDNNNELYIMLMHTDHVGIIYNMVMVVVMVMAIVKLMNMKRGTELVQGLRCFLQAGPASSNLVVGNLNLRSCLTISNNNFGRPMNFECLPSILCLELTLRLLWGLEDSALNPSVI